MAGLKPGWLMSGRGSTSTRSPASSPATGPSPGSAFGSFSTCADLARLFEIRQLRSRQSKPYRARDSRLTVDESARLQRLNHLVHDRRRHSEKPLQIRFGRRPAVDLRVVVDVREILSLLRGEGLHLVDDRFGLGLLISKRVLDAREPVAHGIKQPPDARFRTMVRFGRHMSGEIVDVIQRSRTTKLDPRIVAPRRRPSISSSMSVRSRIRSRSCGVSLTSTNCPGLIRLRCIRSEEGACQSN